MESSRRKKVASLLQKEIAQMLQGSIRKEGVSNLMVSVTKVVVAADLSVAKVYLSLFPSAQAQKTLEGIQSNSLQIKYDLAKLLRNQLRKTPNLTFYLDDSLDYIDKIDEALRQTDDPIKNPESLISRQKK